LETIDQMLTQKDMVGRRSSIDPNKLKLDLNALEANMALLDAEYGQNMDRMQNVELNSLQEYCEKLNNGKHAQASASVDRLDEINLRMTELPDQAAQYKATLSAAIDTEIDYLQRQKDLAIKVNEFQFECKQLGESTTSPLSGLVFSVASAEEALENHQASTAAQLEELEGNFVSLQEAEAHLESIKPNSVAAENETTTLKSEVDGCTDAVAKRTAELEELLRVEQEKETLRVQFAEIANNMRAYVDEKTAELGQHNGSLETQLAALEALQEDYSAKQSDMENASTAAEAQDAAGVVVDAHTPETFETLRAAWNGLSAVYSKAAEAISAQILAEQTAGLTPEQIAEANEVFDEFDIDHNGDLNLQEFHDCCTSLGLLLDKDEAGVKHAQLDTDSSGRVDRGEFLKFYAAELTYRCDILYSLDIYFLLRGFFNQLFFLDHFFPSNKCSLFNLLQ